MTETQETQESPKTTIRPDTDGYVKARTASGNFSQHNGDLVAQGLQGLNIDEVKELAVNVTGDDALRTKYDHLNVGQQRMNLGNRLRGFVAKQNKLAEKEPAEGETQAESGDSIFERMVKPFREAADKREAEAAEARQKREEERKAKAEAKAKEKAEKAEAAKEEESE